MPLKTKSPFTYILNYGEKECKERIYESPCCNSESFCNECRNDGGKCTSTVNMTFFGRLTLLECQCTHTKGNGDLPTGTNF